jgi:ADP-heptose:LPS heptosyltransferase
MIPGGTRGSHEELMDTPTGIASRHSRHLAEALAEFRRLKEARQLTPESAMMLAQQAASAFLEADAAAREYLSAAITLLCELATIEESSLAQAGIHGLFPLLIERLGDAFTPEACGLYNQLFAQVIQHCRRLPTGQSLDQQLRRFGLSTPTDLLGRAAHIRKLKRFDPGQTPRIKKVFVVSRVTLGADVAVTSVALAALQHVFPTAEIGLVANAKAYQLFAGDPRVQLYAIEYPRGGGLIERLASWQRAVEVLQQQTQGLAPTELVIVDPDSRLTQLGLLPLIADERAYFFFESRSYSVPGIAKLGALTAHWLQQVFDIAAPIYPYCSPAPQDVVAAQAIVGGVKSRRARLIVSINLGVGANPAKRLPDPFESRLLTRLLSDGAVIILDKGGEPEEAARVDRLVASLERQGFRAFSLDEHVAATSFPDAMATTQLLTWQGGIGRMAALIAESDVYIGYDSAGQHIAAAFGVPTIDIFTGFTSPRMPERWSPHGPGPVHMLVLEDAESFTRARLAAVVDDVLAHVPRG